MKRLTRRGGGRILYPGGTSTGEIIGKAELEGGLGCRVAQATQAFKATPTPQRTPGAAASKFRRRAFLLRGGREEQGAAWREGKQGKESDGTCQKATVGRAGKG